MKIGVDIVKISRIEKSIKSPAFLKRVFSEKERELITQKGASSAAANFAGKEAFFKAVGTGIKAPLCDVEILRRDTGEPYISLSNELREKYKDITFSVSLSHEKEYAIAFLVAEDKK